MNALHRIVGIWTPDEDHRSALIERYRTPKILLAYLGLVYGTEPDSQEHAYTVFPNDEFYDIYDRDLIGDQWAVLDFPRVYGLDPEEPETAEWAKFAVPRQVQRAAGNYDEVTRFQSSADVGRAIRCHVPLSYFQALDIGDWYTYIPVDAVIRAWDENLTPEYARAIVY